MSAYRSSDPALAYGDLPPPGPQRWDREKFDRYSRGGGGYDERDYYAFRERDTFSPRRESRFAEADTVERRGPRRFEERDRFYEEDRYGPAPRRRPEFMDEPTSSEIANRALLPYRRKSIVERDFDRETVRRPRPNFIRRQSSLDTFDRRPMPRYGDEYYTPADVPIPPPRRPEPPRERIRERDFEEVRYRDLEPEGFDEYEDIHIRREVSRGPRRAGRAAKSVRSDSTSTQSSFEEVSIEKKEEKVEMIGKRGKTRMPKRLAHKQAVIDIGLPFEEEEDFIIIQRALGKEHIDEIIEKSKTYKAAGAGVEKEKLVYKYEENIEGGGVALPPPPPAVAPLEANEEVVMKRTEIYEGAPPPPPLTFGGGSRSRGGSPTRSVASHATHRTHGTHHTRARSASTHQRREFVEERVERSTNIDSPLAVLAPERQSKSDREIRREIASLEAERRALRLEREADEKRAMALAIRDRDDYEVIERREIIEDRGSRDRERDIVRVEKDRKGRMALVRSAH